MTLEKTLRELEERRTGFVEYRAEVEADLRRERERRLAAETQGILQLVLTAAAEGATLGQIKRAYGTKDHRTIADMVRDHRAEIDVIRKRLDEQVKGQPDWINFEDDTFTVDVGEAGQATYTWVVMEDETFMFVTEDTLWDPEYTTKNEAVEKFDGKHENDNADTRKLATVLRKYLAKH